MTTTTDTRAADYEIAKAKWLAARDRLIAAVTRKDKREANDAAELWSGRMAMLSVKAGW